MLISPFADNGSQCISANICGRSRIYHVATDIIGISAAYCLMANPVNEIPATVYKSLRLAPVGVPGSEDCVDTGNFEEDSGLKSAAKAS